MLLMSAMSMRIITCCFLQGNGIIVGLGICGVVFAATSSAATLMGDFRTGYICLAAPRAMFVAQLVGQLMGAVLAPLAFMLYYSTGQVRVVELLYLLLVVSVDQLICCLQSSSAAIDSIAANCCSQDC